MRYLKVLVLVVLFFLSLVFLFQNQAALSTKMVLELNLLVIPVMKSIELPFYVIVLVAFLVGAVLAVLILFWDRVRLTARLMRAKWRCSSLEDQQRKLMKELEIIATAAVGDRPGIFDRAKAQYMLWCEQRKSQKEKDKVAARERKRAIAMAKVGKDAAPAEKPAEVSAPEAEAQKA